MRPTWRQFEVSVIAGANAQSVLDAHRAAKHPDGKATVNSLIEILDDRKW
jgi:hypothetical protein